MTVSRLPFVIDDLRSEILKEGCIDPDITIMLDNETYVVVTSALKSYTGDYVVVSSREPLEFRYRGVSIVRRSGDAKSPA